MTTPAKRDNWVSDLAFEVALGYYTPEELQIKFDLSDTDLDAAQRLPQFQRAVTNYRREIDEDGTEFKLKARKLASELLPELATIAADGQASHKDRIDAIREMAKLAGYGKEDAKSPNGAEGFQVNITFNNPSGDAHQSPAIDVTPEPADANG